LEACLLKIKLQVLLIFSWSWVLYGGACIVPFQNGSNVVMGVHGASPTSDETRVPHSL
jgi:hypothetical protein